MYPYLLSDGVFKCVIDTSETGLIENTLTSIPLPNLNRAYASFHHICGNNSPLDGSLPRNCSINVGLLAPTSSDVASTFYEINSNKIYNDGSLGLMTEMFYESLSLPVVSDGNSLRIGASFDARYGGFAVDNFKFFTPQRYSIFYMYRRGLT